MTEDSRTSQTTPVLEEQLRVNKVERELDRIAIKTTVSERTEYADLELRRSNTEVERVVINRVVDAVPLVRREGDVLIVPVVEEIMVVEKRLLLKEEIRVRQKQAVKHVREPVVLRSEEVTVSRERPHPDQSESQGSESETKEKS